EGGSQRAGPGEDADQAALVVDHGGEPVAAVVQHLERPARVEPGGQGEQRGGHDLGELGVHVDALAVGLGDHADRTVLPIDHDDRTVGALGQQVERFADGVVRGEGDRGVVDQIAFLDPVDDVGDDVEGNVLGNDGDAPATGDGLGHPAPGHRRHVRHHDGDGGAGAVVGRQVHGETGVDGGPRGDHEHVGVGQLVRRSHAVEEFHVYASYPVGCQG